MPRAHAALPGDDERLLPEARSKVLGRHGIHPLEACCGEAASRSTDGSQPDVVILDVKIPGQERRSVLRCVQDLRPTAPATVLSGHGGVEVGPHALRWGAFDFKTKPVKVAKLLGATGKAIRSRSLAEEAARREG